MGSQDVYPMPAIDRYEIIHVTREGVRRGRANDRGPRMGGMAGMPRPD